MLWGPVPFPSDWAHWGRRKCKQWSHSTQSPSRSVPKQSINRGHAPALAVTPISGLNCSQELGLWVAELMELVNRN